MRKRTMVIKCDFCHEEITPYRSRFPSWKEARRTDVTPGFHSFTLDFTHVPGSEKDPYYITGEFLKYDLCEKCFSKFIFGVSNLIKGEKNEIN